MSVWIQTASAASKQIRGGLPPFKIVGVVVVIFGFVSAVVSQRVQESYPANPEVQSGERCCFNRIEELCKGRYLPSPSAEPDEWSHGPS
jgi:hypothetical protein